METEKQEVRCPKCSHKFKTKSKDLVNCNVCGKKFHKKENLVKPKGQRELRT